MEPDRNQALQFIYNNWFSCTRCNLCRERHNVVPGWGSPWAHIMIVGEGPGEMEDKCGRPFMGRAGDLQDQYLAGVSASQVVVATHEALVAASTQEERDSRRAELHELLCDEYYMTNVIACRPPDNRDPAADEITACRQRLIDLIYVIDPVLIVAVGGIALSTLIGKKISITSKRGELYDMEMQGRLVSYRIPVMATLHPAYLARTADWKDPHGECTKTYKDWLRVMKIYDELRYRHFGVDKPKRPLKED